MKNTSLPSQPPRSDQNVECMVYYEPHEVNASLSSGSDRGSHAGSGSGSGSSSHVVRKRNLLTSEGIGSGKSSPGVLGRPNATPPTVPTHTTSQFRINSKLTGSKPPSLYAHGDFGVRTQDSAAHNSGLASQPQTNMQSGPAYSNVVPSTFKNHSTGNYMPMDQYLYKDSGAGSSVSGSTRQEETASSVGLEDSGIDIGTANYLQTGYASSRASAYSHDDYLLPLSHRVGGIPSTATEDQLKLQELQLKRQEQQLQELQKQHLQIKQQLQQQHTQQIAALQPAVHPEHIEMSALNVQAKSGTRLRPELPAKPAMPLRRAENLYSETPGSNPPHNPDSTSTNHGVPTPAPNGMIGKYGRRAAVKNSASESAAKSALAQSYTAKQDTQFHAPHGRARYEANGRFSHFGKKHTFAPQEGYTEAPASTTSRSSVRSSRSASSKGSSSQGRMKAGHDPNRPVAANIILNIPGYRVPASLGRSKRISSAEESDMESMTSVSVTSREVANIMTQAMRMQRNSTRRRSKCEHHHRTFATKPGRSGNLSRSSNFRGSNSSNRSKGKRSCTRCGSQSQKQTQEKNGESLISFIEQSMRSFLLNSSETVSTEDTSSETKSSSVERNDKTPSADSPENNETVATEEKPQSKSSKPPPPPNPVSAAPSLFDIASYCELHTLEIHNDYSNTLGYGMHLQQVNFNPEGLVKASGKFSSNGVHLGQGSSAFERFQGRTRLIYCIHKLDKTGIAAKHGALKEGDYLIEVINKVQRKTVSKMIQM